MKQTIKMLTIFPEIFDSFLKVGLLEKAIAKGSLDVETINIRDFTDDPHRSVDDTPYGGGAGMLMKVEPVVKALEAAGDGKKILLSPQGRRFDQKRAMELAKQEKLVFLCGRYEGFDERICRYVDMLLSVGDYVLHGGEVAAMVITEAVVRLHPDFMGNEHSLSEETFSSGLLEYPQYTRPESFRGMGVPKILLSGHHENMRRWRRGFALLRTKRLRPDLFERLTFSEEDIVLLAEAEAADSGT